MTTAIFQQSFSFRAYFADVSKAAQALASALFAAQERQFVALEVAPTQAISGRARMKNHTRLIRMANEYQDMQPSLAAELRQLAGRG